MAEDSATALTRLSNEISAQRQADEAGKEAPARSKDYIYFLNAANKKPIVVTRAAIFEAKARQRFIGRLPPTLLVNTHLMDSTGALWQVKSIAHLLSPTDNGINEIYISLTKIL